MQTLPEEIVLVIFGYVSDSYNYNLYRTSKRFRAYLSMIFKRQYNSRDLLACLLYYQTVQDPEFYIAYNAIFLGTIEVLLKLNMKYASRTKLDIISYCCKHDKLSVIVHVVENDLMDYTLQKACLYRRENIIEYALNDNIWISDKATLIAATNNDTELVKRLMKYPITDYLPILVHTIINGNDELFCHITNNLPYSEHRKMYAGLLRRATKEKNEVISKLITEMKALDRQTHFKPMPMRRLRLMIRKNHYDDFISKMKEYSYNDYRIEYQSLVPYAIYQGRPHFLTYLAERSGSESFTQYIREGLRREYEF